LIENFLYPEVVGDRLIVSIAPKVTISGLVQKLKGSTSHKLMMTFPSMQKQYWGHHMWARGYFCYSSGNITDEIIKNYIENQHDSDDEFKID
jgi:putative transposase